MKLVRQNFLPFFLFILSTELSAQTYNLGYPSYQTRKVSLGKTTYYIDPLTGNDGNNGINRKTPWKTFNKINSLVLISGDKVEVLSPGKFHETLTLMARGKKSSPVIVSFAPGRYDFFPDHTLKIPLHISNTNVKPYEPKSIAIMCDSCTFTTIQGASAKIVLRGKMMETYINNSENIKIQGLTFDYQRPTVSELKVINVEQNYADLEIHKDSKFSIKDSTITWIGEGWSYQPGYLWQMLNLQTNVVNRLTFKMQEIHFVSKGGNNVRAYFKKNPGFIKDYVYQNREIERDCAGVFMQHSKNIELKDLTINFMHGMGIVAQFCENIKIKKTSVKPEESSGRTCAAWADILHFSGCKGMIDIGDSYLSAANDDAINVHGTYLKIVKMEGPNQVKLKFMHPETYGFNPFSIGDSVEFIKQSTLLAKGNNIVAESIMVNDKEVLLTLKNALSSNIDLNDFVENITATPSVAIHNNIMARIPTRGILVTTRRKIKIWNNDFQHTYMSGILVGDDASVWYESGKVKELSIYNNTFNLCGEPVISIAPENKEITALPVHNNIAIIGNKFMLHGSKWIYAKSTSKLTIKDNVITKPKPVQEIEKMVELNATKEVNMTNNKIKAF